MATTTFPSDIVACVRSGVFLDKDLKAVAIFGGDIQELDANSLTRIDVPHDHCGVDRGGPEPETQTNDGPRRKALPGFDKSASNADVAETLGGPSEQSILTEPDFTIESDAWIYAAFGHVLSALKGASGVTS